MTVCCSHARLDSLVRFIHLKQADKKHDKYLIRCTSIRIRNLSVSYLKFVDKVRVVTANKIAYVYYLSFTANKIAYVYYLSFRLRLPIIEHMSFRNPFIYSFP
jgi:hypothetical protein